VRYVFPYFVFLKFVLFVSSLSSSSSGANVRSTPSFHCPLKSCVEVVVFPSSFHRCWFEALAQTFFARPSAAFLLPSRHRVVEESLSRRCSPHELILCFINIGDHILYQRISFIGFLDLIIPLAETSNINFVCALSLPKNMLIWFVSSNPCIRFLLSNPLNHSHAWLNDSS